MSELVKKYSVDILKKINFELGNAIKTACDVSCHCSKNFRRKENLSLHIKTVHQKEKAFLCQELGCGKKFGQNNELRDHMRSAHGAPKLVCKKAECSATFVWATVLYKHMREDH